MTTIGLTDRQKIAIAIAEIIEQGRANHDLYAIHAVDLINEAEVEDNPENRKHVEELTPKIQEIYEVFYEKLKELSR